MGKVRIDEPAPGLARTRDRKIPLQRSHRASADTGLKQTMDNGFGGRQYEIDKKRIRPPRAPVKLSAEARAKRAKQVRQNRVLSAENAIA